MIVHSVKLLNQILILQTVARHKEIELWQKESHPSLVSVFFFVFFFLLTKKKRKEPWLLSTSDKNTTRSIVLCNWGAQVAAWGKHAPGARGRAEQGSLPGDWDHVKWNPQGERKADIGEDLQQWVTTKSEQKQIHVVVHSSSLWPRTWIVFSQFHQWHPGDEKR